ncbi:plasmid mobilization protein [Tissierella carlieri]|uniref:plasmid mobilization protein n=1 Tax=Tissierella carlieri TaxID=689904 RepID=UPI0038670E3A
MGQKTERKTFRFSPEELRVIEKKAEKANLKVSEFIRQAALDKNIVVIEELKDFNKALKGIGNNLNQLTILAHQGKINVVNENDLSEVKEKVNEIWQLLNSLMVKTKKKKG